MKDVRIGNDISVIWSLYSDQKPFLLDGLKISVYLKGMYGKTKIEDYTIKDNEIHWTFFGKDQKHTGKYSLTLVINEGAEGMVTTDVCDLVRLVSCTCQADGTDEDGVQTETIAVNSEVELLSGGFGRIDTALDPMSENAVSNAVITAEFGKVNEATSGLKTQMADDKAELMTNLEQVGVLAYEAAMRSSRNEQNKVDKIEGKGLSTNDYTDEDRSKLTELSEEIRIFTNDASYPSQWDSAIRLLALNLDATINISEIYVLVHNGTIQLWAYNNGNIVWQSVTNLDAIAEGSIFPLKTESNAFTGVVALLSLRNKNELVDWGSLSAKLNINVLINSFPYIYANAINKDSFQYAAVIDNIKDTSVIDRESGYIENRIADDVVELYVLPNARFGINKLALVDDSNAFHLWGYDNNNIIWRCDLPFSSFENGVVMPIECTSDGGNVVRHEVVAYIVFSNIEDYKTLSDGSVRVLTWEKVTNIVYNSHILNYFLSNTSENQKIDNLEERLVNIEDNITVDAQEKSEVVLGRASEGWVEHFFDKPIPKGAVIANVGMYPYPAIVYLTDEHGDIVVEEQLNNIRSSVPYTTTKAYRGYKGNEDAKFAIFLEGENGKTRKSITITSSMSQIDIYNAMWFAFYEGDVDVFFETGIYEFTDELFAYIKYTLDLSYTVGLPIGNGCRYFFNNSTLKATALGEYYHNQNILDTQAQAGDFELHDVILDGTGVTYCVHDEAQGEDTPCMHKYDNVTFIINDAYACIGMGTGYNETVILENCIFKPSQFVQHAPTNNTGDKVVTNNYYIRGCYFDGKVFDIGTAQLDKSRDKISMCISNCAMKGKIGTSQEFLSEYIEFNNTLL